MTWTGTLANSATHIRRHRTWRLIRFSTVRFNYRNEVLCLHSGNFPSLHSETIDPTVLWLYLSTISWQLNNIIIHLHVCRHHSKIAKWRPIKAKRWKYLAKIVWRFSYYCQESLNKRLNSFCDWEPNTFTTKTYLYNFDPLKPTFI